MEKSGRLSDRRRPPCVGLNWVIELFGSAVNEIRDLLESFGCLSSLFFVFQDSPAVGIVEACSFLVEFELVFGVLGIFVGRILIEEIEHLFVGIDGFLIDVIVVAGDVKTGLELIEGGIGRSSLDSLVDVFYTFFCVLFAENAVLGRRSRRCVEVAARSVEVVV